MNETKDALQLKPSDFEEIAKFIKPIQGELDLLNVGSSIAAAGLDYSGTSLNAVNLAASPQSLHYDSQIIETYGRLLKKGGIALLPISPFVGCVPYYRHDSANYRYYAFLKSSGIRGYTEAKAEAIREFLRCNPPGSGKAEATQLASSEEFELHAERIVRHWKSEFTISDLSLPPATENQEKLKLSAEILRKSLAFCAANHIRPVLLLMPASRYLRRYFTDQFVENYILAFLRMAQPDGGTASLDYLRDEKWCDPALFANSFLLNARGRRLFTAEVLSKLYRNKTAGERQ